MMTMESGNNAPNARTQAAADAFAQADQAATDTEIPVRAIRREHPQHHTQSCCNEHCITLSMSTCLWLCVVTPAVVSVIGYVVHETDGWRTSIIITGSLFMVLYTMWGLLLLVSGILAMRRITAQRLVAEEFVAPAPYVATRVDGQHPTFVLDPDGGLYVQNENGERFAVNDITTPPRSSTRNTVTNANSNTIPRNALTLGSNGEFVSIPIPGPNAPANLTSPDALANPYVI